MQRIFPENFIKLCMIPLVRHILNLESISELHNCKMFDKICLKNDNYNNDIVRYICR